MNRRTNLRFHVPVTIAFTVATTIHGVAAWAADGGTDASAVAGDAGSDAPDPDNDPSSATCGDSHPEARNGRTALFGAGCC